MVLRLRDGTPVWLHASDPADAHGERAEIVALGRDGCDLGRVGYRRIYGPRAVLTLAVDDESSSRGLAEALIAAVAATAAGAGIATLMIRVAASDERLLGMLARAFAARWRREGSHVDVELRTAPQARPPAPVVPGHVGGDAIVA